MSKEEIITAVAVTTDKGMLSRIADILNHRDQHPVSRAQDRETRLLTQKEAAKRLSLSTTSLWRLIREGAIETVNVRGRRRVRLASLMDYALGKER